MNTANRSASGRDIICLSSIDWDFIWQGHQQIMTTFATGGNRVLFVENTGVRAPNLRDLPRMLQRLRNWLRGTKGFRQERENLFIYSPLILPFPYSRVARWLNRRLLLRALERWMRAMGCGRPILWTFLPTPLALEVIRGLDPMLTVYYCIDDLASSSSAARRIARSEFQLFRQADLVFVTSERLRARARQFTDRVHLFPFGVDFEQCERVRHAPDELPQELRRLPRPIIGYVGGLHQWIDQELVAALASQLPEASLVFVGPFQTDISRLAAYPNLHLLGARAHEDLPRYIKGFDVGIVPYRLSEYTAHVYPTKLNEYLGMGIPVVSTALPEIERFNAEYGRVVAVAHDAGEFARSICDALNPPPPEVIQRRIAVSRQNSWDARIAKMSTLIEQALAARKHTEARWQESLKRLYRVAHRRLLTPILATVFAYLILFHTSFIWIVAEPLRMSEPPRPADAIVVFAGGVGESGKAGGGGGYQERVKQAVDLYHQGLARHLIFSSGYTFVFREAEVMKDLATGLGVPTSAILLEMKAANTFQNVAHVAAILDREQWDSVLLVSSPYHMRRAVLTFRKVAPTVTVIPSPVPGSQFYAHERGARFEQVQAILHEYLAMLSYWSKGWM